MTGWLVLLAWWPLLLVGSVLLAFAALVWFALGLESFIQSYADTGGPPWERGMKGLDSEEGEAAATAYAAYDAYDSGEREVLHDG